MRQAYTATSSSTRKATAVFSLQLFFLLSKGSCVYLISYVRASGIPRLPIFIFDRFRREGKERAEVRIVSSSSLSQVSALGKRGRNASRRLGGLFQLFICSGVDSWYLRYIGVFHTGVMGGYHQPTARKNQSHKTYYFPTSVRIIFDICANDTGTPMEYLVSR